MKQNKKATKAIETARNARKLKLQSVMNTAWELYRDITNDLNCFALALKCAWAMHTDAVNAADVPDDLQEIYSKYPIARAYLKRGGGKNRVKRNGDGTLTDFWFDTKDACQKFLQDPDSIYLVCHYVWALNKQRVNAGKAPYEIWKVIGRVAEKVYMKECDVHRLTRDVIGADGVKQKKRIRTRIACPTSAMERVNSDGETYSILDTETFATTDEHDDMIYDDIVRTCAHDDTDRIILRMKRDGVKEKEIASFIGISAPAVTKRLNKMYARFTESK